MRVLALYLKEFEYKKVSGKDVLVENVSSSDRQVLDALHSLGHDAVMMEYDKSSLKSVKGNFDLVFNLCDGLENDDDFQEVPILKQIEKLDIPFTGNSSKAVKDCCDKSVIKRVLIKNDISTPQFQVFKKSSQRIKSSLHFPLIVKPLCTDGGVGISNKSIVHSKAELKKQLKKCIRENHQPAIVEEFIQGREFCVPVLGSKVLPPVEIVFKPEKNLPGILSYDAKWNKSSKSYLQSRVCVRNKITNNFPIQLRQSIENSALKTFRAMDCSSYASVDIRVDKNGKIFVLEINPNCWIGKGSDFVRSADSIGISYLELMYRIMELSKDRIDDKKK